MNTTANARPTDENATHNTNISRVSKEYVNRVNGNSRKQRNAAPTDDPLSVPPPRLESIEDRATVELYNPELLINWSCCNEEMSKETALHYRFYSLIEAGYIPRDSDLKSIAAAIKRITQGDDPKKALGIGGRQYQGRNRLSRGEAYAREQIASSVIGYMFEMSKEAAIAKVTTKLNCGPHRTDLDAAETFERGRRYVERCYNGLSELERKDIRCEFQRDAYEAAHPDEFPF